MASNTGQHSSLLTRPQLGKLKFFIRQTKVQKLEINLAKKLKAQKKLNKQIQETSHTL